MNYKVIIFAEAKLDITEAAIWYNEKQALLGKRFLNAVKDEVKMIKQNPLIYEIRYDEIRTGLLKTFPYLIHFSIESNLIIIKAVYHTSRNSSVWITRN